MRARAALALALGALAGGPAVAAARDPGTALVGPPPASAATTAATSEAARSSLVRVTDLDRPPAGWRRTGREVVRAAAAAPAIRRELRARPQARPSVFLKSSGLWQVSWFGRERPPRELAVAYVGDATGRVTEAWTGWQVAWTMARGYPGAFGRDATALWIWLPLTLLFVAPFVDRRRPWRGPAVDLALVALFGVSLAFFDDARIDASVPLAYPLLVLLLARLLWIGLRRSPDPAARRALPLLVPAGWLAAGLLFLLAFRVTLNVADSNVIDVGYAGVLGADRLADGTALWGHFPRDNAHGDTYGPLTYLAYVPAEQLLPWSGRWDGLPAAHVVAIAADLACVALLFALGRRLRDTALGIVLAYAWAACPFTLLALASNSNDALVAALVLGALLAATRPAARGALVGAAGWAKLAPLALAPLLATAGPAPRRRSRRRFLAGLGAVTALALAIVLGYGGPGTFYDRTLAYQAARDSPFSIWGLWGGPWGTVQLAVQAGAVALAVAVAYLPRREDLVGLAALAGAVLVALQLGVEHWFYLYLPWVLGPLLVAALGRYGTSTCSIASARSGAAQRTTTALSQGSSSEGSNRTESWVRRLSIACSRRTPSTPPRAPVIPTSVQ
jgi:hypothetical protein